MAAAVAVVDPEAEARRQKQLAAARAERAKQLKRGPGVAALVQGALKRAQTQPTVAKKPEAAEPVEDLTVDRAAPKKVVEPESDEESEETVRQRREEMARAEAARRKAKAEQEAKERERAERA